MSNDYNDRIKQVRDEISQHNAALDPTDPKVDAEEIVKAIKSAGALTVRALASLELADLPATTPRLLKKAIVEIAQGGGTPTAPVQAVPATAPAAPAPQTQHIIVSQDRPEDMSNAMLLERFDPDSQNAVWAELSRRAGNRKFLLYPAGTLDRARSLARLELMLNHRPVTETVEIGGVHITPRGVGDPYRQEMAPENPLRPGEALCDNGSNSTEVCGWTGVDWKGIPLEARQVIRLALVDTKEIEGLTKVTARLIIAAARSGISEVSQAYPKAAAKLAEMPAGQKPVLELDLSTTARAEVAPRGPFDRTERTWR